MVSFGLHLPNYVLLKFNTSDLWSSSTPIVNELQPHAHMPSRRAFPWEQFNRQKTSRTIDNSHGKFWTFLFAQLFHCNSTSLTCNLPSLQFYTWITNTKNHAPPSSRRKKSIRKKTSKRVTHSCAVSFWLFLCSHLFHSKYLQPTYHLPNNHEWQSPLPTTFLSLTSIYNRFCVMMQLFSPACLFLVQHKLKFEKIS